jgi:predicted ATPase
MMQQQNMQAQAQANAQAQQVAAQAAMQKEQALHCKLRHSLNKLKVRLEQERMKAEVAAKKELMELEFQYNIKLKGWRRLIG